MVTRLLLRLRTWLRIFEQRRSAYSGWPLWWLIPLYRRSYFRHLAASLTPLLTQGQVLEIGAGPGHLAVDISKLGLRVTVVGVDINEAQLAEARKRVAKNRLGDRLTFTRADVHELPFGKGIFDLAVSTYSAHQWGNLSGAAMELYRVLKPGGVLRIEVGRPFVYPGWLSRLRGKAAPAAGIAQAVEKAGFQHVKEARNRKRDLLIVTAVKEIGR